MSKIANRLRVVMGGLAAQIAAATPNLDWTFIFLLLLSGTVLMYRISDPPGSLIFDEVYYVQAARVIAGQPVVSHHLPVDWMSLEDPNREHPPLAKVIIAAGISVFQEDALGWRLPSVLLGLLTLGSVYGITLRSGGSRRQAQTAVTLLMLDTMFFLHSRIATLDIYFVSLGLFAVYLYMDRKPEWAGLLFALATCCKINGLFAFAGLFGFEISNWFQGKRLKRPYSLRRLQIATLFYLTFSYSILGVLDGYFTQFRTPVAHLVHIVNFGKALHREAGVSPQGIEATPLEWWLNEKDVDYLSLNLVDEKNNKSAPIKFRGLFSPYLISAAPLVLAFCFLRGWRGDVLCALTLCSVASSYGILFITWIKFRRICYLYYFLGCIPWICVGLARALEELPDWCRHVFRLTLLFSFVMYFPFRG